jgi:hypothetical protein
VAAVELVDPVEPVELAELVVSVELTDTHTTELLLVHGHT